MVDHERQRRRLVAARRPGANVARPLTDFPVGRCEVHVPREHANGERFWTWCSVVGVKEGRLLVDVPEPFGNVVTPMTIAFLEKHREMSDRDFVRSATVEADSCDERKPSLLPPPASKKPRVAPKASQPQPVAAPVPRVVLKLQEPAADSTSAASSVQQLLLAAKLAEKEQPSGDGLAQQQRQRQLTTAVKKPTTPPSLWPSGGDWRPSTKNWGTRSAGAYGCGKCRWRPAGCRGCIAAAASYRPPPPPPLAPGVVSIPRGGVDEDCDRGAGESHGGDRHAGLRELMRSVTVTSHGVVDACGSGVVALRHIEQGAVLLDPSVVFVNRPSEYAQAHLPQFHALEFGTAGYFRLREPAYGHCSLTYFVNEAGHEGMDNLPTGRTRDECVPNVRYRVVRPRGGGIALGLECLTDIAPGTELLCRYNQKLT